MFLISVLNAGKDFCFSRSRPEMQKVIPAHAFLFLITRTGIARAVPQTVLQKGTFQSIIFLLNLQKHSHADAVRARMLKL